MRRRWCLAGLVAAGWAVPAAAQDCASLRGTYGGAVVVTAATPIRPDAARPFQPDTPGGYKPIPVRVPLCRAAGTIEGNIGFELWLPLANAWNGRLLGAGVGGDAGVFN